MGAADFSQVGSIRVSTSFTQPSPVVIANNPAAVTSAFLGGDDARLPFGVAGPSGREVDSHSPRSAPTEAEDSQPSAPEAQGEDAAPDAGTAQGVAPAELPADIPLNVPLSHALTDACFAAEMQVDWLDGEAAWEPAWFAEAVTIPQLAQAGVLLGFINAPVRARALLNKEDPCARQRLGVK
jgi:hypothetical protein